jgi:hypothetical protein
MQSALPQDDVHHVTASNVTITPPSDSKKKRRRNRKKKTKAQQPQNTATTSSPTESATASPPAPSLVSAPKAKCSTFVFFFCMFVFAFGIEATGVGPLLIQLPPLATTLRLTTNVFSVVPVVVRTANPSSLCFIQQLLFIYLFFANQGAHYCSRECQVAFFFSPLCVCFLIVHQTNETQRCWIGRREVTKQSVYHLNK